MLDFTPASGYFEVLRPHGGSTSRAAEGARDWRPALTPEI